MDEQQLRGLAAAGVDIQLHSHRHQWPLYDKEIVESEIAENRRFLQRCRLVSAGAFLLSKRSVRSPPGRMAGGIGGEERHDDRTRIELRPHLALRAASPGRWRACVGYRIRRRDDRLYGTRALVAAPVARGRGMMARKRVYRNEEGPAPLAPQRRSAVDARHRIFSGVRCDACRSFLCRRSMACWPGMFFPSGISTP